LGGKKLNKILPILVIGIFVLSGLGAVAITDDKTYNEEVEEESIVISEPVIEDTGQYVTVNIEEATSSILEPGKPMLPIVTKVFTFPFGTKISSVDLSFSEVNELILPKEVQPAPEPVLMNVKLQVVKEHIKDSTVYESEELYPTSEYSFITASGLDNDKHVVYLAVQWFPVRYSPMQNMIYYSKNADIKITYEEPTNPIVFNDVYDMVIIAPSEYLDELQSLVDHKNSREVESTIKTTEAIYAEYEGYDEAEEIKYFIKDAIENWGTKYVLLVGSIDKLPIRTTWFSQRWHQHYWNITVLTDLYYADIYDEFGDFCSWDSDGDGRYGEVFRNCPGVNDTLDLFPDVNIGRLACDDAEEVNIVVDKIIYYETNTYGKSWFNNILLLGGDTFPFRNGNEGEILNLIIEEIMSDFIPTKLWTSTYTFRAWRINLALYKGAGFVDYSGHGIANAVGTHPTNSNKWIMYNEDNLKALLNGYKLPIVFFDACLTAKLDYNESNTNVYRTTRIFNSFLFNNIFKSISRILRLFLDGYNLKSLSINLESNDVLSEPRDDPKLLPCFAWSWIKKDNGGAIATIGATRTAFGGTDSGAGKMSIEFFSAYENSESLGEMMSQAQIEYIFDVPWDLFTLEEFILLGDPSLKVGGYNTLIKQR
jgi:hypothetical protein